MKSTLQNKVQTYRQTAKLTQAELAVLVGVTRQTIIAMEKGNYVPSVALALALARALQTSVEALFYESK